ncbi:MAG: hypothetical protein J6R99_01370, partial [Alphaproteobacteria bacterium]|nr:hypothetical protein [Alphaproteobacteria bacterium]
IITADFGFGNPIKNETISTDKLQVSAYEVRFVNPNDPEDDFHYTLTEKPTSTEHLHQLLITEIQREEDGNEEDMINYVKTLDMEDFDIEYATYNFDLQFFGKEIGMKYAELATMTMHGVENGVEFTEPQVLVGGDETKLVETIDPTQKYEFGGKAIAMVDYEFETYDNNAKLVLDPENNTETLTMNLADWYNVEIVNNDGNVVLTLMTQTKLSTVNIHLMYTAGLNNILKQNIMVKTQTQPKRQPHLAQRYTKTMVCIMTT